ncbi:MAG: hypothetical protein LBC88_09380 [Spirochaetaceae bacterium]|jgi:hypothetical protein|nr:hypothetical protein [Spirochaetaceae bacterium]
MQADDTVRRECRDFCAVLERELALIERIEESQKLVREAVRRRAWADFEMLQESMRRLGAEFEELDREREAGFYRLSGAAMPPPSPESGGFEAGFYALIARLPADERDLLAERYRELKYRALAIRAANESLLHYLSGIRLLVSDFLDAAFPDRKGKLYTRQGTTQAADMRSMVLNRHF